MIPGNLKSIATISRPHGIDGTVLLFFRDDFDGELNKGEFLFVSIDGTMIPFFVEELQFVGDFAYIRFKDITTPEKTEFLKGKEVYISSKRQQKSKNLESLEGFLVHDNISGREGTITAFYENGENPLFSILNSSNEFLVPANPALIVSVDYKRKIIVMNLPEGLLSLDE